jgi:hypothetical protein
MSVIVSENFDALSPPALPAGWTFSSGSWITSAALSNSSPNSLRNGASGSVETATIDTSDSNSGDADLLAAVQISGVTGNDEVFLGVRCTASAADGYFVALQIGASDPKGITIYKRISGTLTAVSSSIGPSAFSAATWYIPEIEVIGTTLNAYCKRASDNKWLQTDGTFGGSRVACVTATDSSISGQGKAGLIVYQSAGIIAIDDVVYSTAGGGGTPATTYTLTGPPTCATGHPSANFTIAPDGTTTATVTPSDGGAGGTFTPTPVIFSGGSASKTFTYTAASSGTKTISITNNSGLTNPASLTIKSGTAIYTAAHPSNRIFYEIIRKDSDGSAYQQTNTIFVSFTSSNWGSITRQLGEQVLGSSGYSEYAPPGFPIATDGGIAGTYTVYIYQQAGSSPSIDTDQPPIEGATIYWDGSQETVATTTGGVHVESSIGIGLGIE